MQMFMSMYAGKSVCEWLRMGIRMGIGALSARWWGSERSRSLSCSPPWNMQMIIWCIIHWRNVLQASSRSSPLSFNWLRWDCVKKKKRNDRTHPSSCCLFLHSASLHLLPLETNCGAVAFVSTQTADGIFTAARIDQGATSFADTHNARRTRTNKTRTVQL